MQDAGHVRPGQPADDAVFPGRARRPSPDSLLPRGGHVRGEIQRVDAGMLPLEVLPEQQPQMTRQSVEAGIAEPRPTLAQIVNEEVADGTAGQVVAVDELFGRALPAVGGAEHPHSRRGLGWEDADSV